MSRLAEALERANRAADAAPRPAVPSAPALHAPTPVAPVHAPTPLAPAHAPPPVAPALHAPTPVAPASLASNPHPQPPARRLQPAAIVAARPAAPAMHTGAGAPLLTMPEPGNQ